MRVLLFPELKTKKGIGWSRKHVTDKVRKHQFPAPIDLGDNTRAWDEEEVDAWLAERKAKRDQPETLATRKARGQKISDRVREDWRRRKAEATELQRIATKTKSKRRKRTTDEATTGPPDLN